MFLCHARAGAKNIEGRIEQFRALLRGFKRILRDVPGKDASVKFELPKACRCWKSLELWSVPNQNEMKKYEFRGCSVGSTGRKNQ